MTGHVVRFVQHRDGLIVALCTSRCGFSASSMVQADVEYAAEGHAFETHGTIEFSGLPQWITTGQATR